MQHGIALTAFLLLKLFDDQFYRCCVFFSYLFRPFSLGLIQIPSIKGKASVLQAHLRTFAPAVKSALVEFHKAQCFFILAIQIAAIIVVKNGTLNDSLTPTTLQRLFSNYTLIGGISISGFLPVSFTLLALHRAGIHSWYLVILSDCAFVLSAVTMFKVGDFQISAADGRDLLITNGGVQYPTCGSVNLTAFCINTSDAAYSKTDFTSTQFSYEATGGPGLLFIFIILLLINLDQLGLQRTSKYEGFVKWLLKWLDTFLRTIHWPSNDQSAQHLLAISKDYIYFFIWVWYLIFIGIALADLYYPNNGTNLTPVMSWTFGQIVAITVWAGPLFEFVKLSVRKCW